MDKHYGPWTLFPNESTSAVGAVLSHIKALFKEKEKEWLRELTKERIEFMEGGKFRYRISLHESQLSVSLFFYREY
jgi:nicotinic acid phosphoribosyltransferase